MSPAHVEAERNIRSVAAKWDKYSGEVLLSVLSEDIALGRGDQPAAEGS